MTGKEAIYLVWGMTPAECASATMADDPMLARVATWRTADPEGWAGILDALQLVARDPLLPRPSRFTARQDVIQVWCARPWLLGELAEHFGVRLSTVEQWRRTWFRGERFITSRQGKSLKAYQLVRPVEEV